MAACLRQHLTVLQAKDIQNAAFLPMFAVDWSHNQCVANVSPSSYVQGVVLCIHGQVKLRLA